MSSVTTQSVLTDIEKHVRSGLKLLRAKHDAAYEAEAAAVRAELERGAARMTGLVSKMQASRPAPVAPALKANGPKPAAKIRKAKVKGEIRFRDPANPKNTWTGRGTVPAWVKAAGGKEACAVAPSA